MDVTLCETCLGHAKCKRPATTEFSFGGIKRMLCDYCEMCMEQASGSMTGLIGTGYIDVMEGRRADHIAKGSCSFCSPING
jgi:hypothetical protein